MRVKITKEHIKNGRRGANECAIALATGGQVGYKMVLLNGKVFELPLQAREFILRFDQDCLCAPLEFDMVEIWPRGEREEVNP